MKLKLGHHKEDNTNCKSRGLLLHCSLFFVFDELNVDCFVVMCFTHHLDMGDLSRNTHYGQLLSAAAALPGGEKEMIGNV